MNSKMLSLSCSVPRSQYSAMDKRFEMRLKKSGIDKKTLKALKKEKVLDTSTLMRYTDDDLKTLNKAHGLGLGQEVNLRSVRNELTSEASPSVSMRGHRARFSR